MQYLNIKPVLILALLPILAVWPAGSARADETFAPPALKRGLICRHFTNFQEFAEYAPKLNGVDEDLLTTWLAEHEFYVRIVPHDDIPFFKKLRGESFYDTKGKLIPGLDLMHASIRFDGGRRCGRSTFKVTWFPDKQGRITDIQTDMVFRSFDTPSAHADEIFAPPALKRGLICRHFTNFQEFAEYAPKLNGVDEDLLISWLVKYGFRGQIFPSDAGLLMRKLRGDFFHDIEGNIIPGLDLRKYGVRFAGRIPCGQSTFLVTWYVDEQNQIIDIDTDMVFRHFDGP